MSNSSSSSFIIIGDLSKAYIPVDWSYRDKDELILTREDVYKLTPDQIDILNEYFLKIDKELSLSRLESVYITGQFFDTYVKTSDQTKCDIQSYLEGSYSGVFGRNYLELISDEFTKTEVWFPNLDKYNEYLKC